MQLLQNPSRTGPCVLVLGMFDGVHLGHQALLSEGKAISRRLGLPLCVCTFEPHPLAVLFPEKNPPRLTTPAERAERMEAFGVDILSIFSFTRDLAAQSPEEFVRRMCEVFEPKAVITGFNFTFGDRGRGNSETLRALQAQYGYETCTVPEVMDSGETVSSTRIRRLLQQGDMEQVTRLLGAPYVMTGCVVRGKQLGRTLGFPTANVQVDPQKAMPAYGVYTCRLQVDGELLPAVVNVGRHPTVPEGQPTVEAHVPGRSLNLYGDHARLIFLSFRRPEQTFASVEALRAQIARDTEDAIRYFAAGN